MKNGSPATRMCEKYHEKDHGQKAGKLQIIAKPGLILMGNKFSCATAMLSVAGSYPRGGASAAPAPGRPPTQVINYLKSGAGVQYAPKQAVPVPQVQPVQVSTVAVPLQMSTQRHKPLDNQSPVGSPATLPPVPSQACPPGASGAQFQRLKVEDALSYLDQVKYKFNAQPQVYNDFLDIMKEFKSQTIDTPGVITRVSSLFKGHTELIVGFNTFLPPGYKIEVQSNGQVSVSMPSPSSLNQQGGVPLPGAHQHHQPPPQPQLVHLLPQQVGGSMGHHNMSLPGGAQSASIQPPPSANTLHHISQAHQQIEAAAYPHHQGGVPSATGPCHPQAAAPVEFNHAIEYVNKIKSRFSRQPDKYKRFLEILHAYQRGHRDLKEPQVKQQTEQEVYAQVAKLFENQDDLLAEFGQFLPDAKTVSAGGTLPTSGAHYPPAPPALHPTMRTSMERDRNSLEVPVGTGDVGTAPARYGPAAPPASPPPPAHHHTPSHHHAPAHHAQMNKHSSGTSAGAASQSAQHHLKRSPSFTSTTQMICSSSIGAPPAKKARPSLITSPAVRDVSYAEAVKYGSVKEYSFFDRVRRALRSQEVYNNFLRCLMLYTNEIISGSELLSITAPFLCRHGELQRWLRDFIGSSSPPHTPTNSSSGIYGGNGVGLGSSYGYGPSSASSLLSFDRDKAQNDTGRAERTAGGIKYEPIGPFGAQLRHDRPQGDAAMDIDLSTCKRLGTSYCALPRTSAEAASRRCSGRTPLCREVLNDTWVSFPTWSEDSTFVTCRKTQFEEVMYRCEDERFELDVVIETNASTIRVLEGVQKKLSRMTSEDATKFRLDDCLGGNSPTIHQRVLRRIYGDKAVDIIAGLKKNPAVAVPVVLRRLKAKEEEWREAQKGFNKQWRDQNEKFYLKSLDHQGITFKANDLKALRSKALLNEIESACTARAGRDRGPHLKIDYDLKTRQEAIKIVRDAAELLIHHARRQTAIQKAEKRRIKQLLRQFLPDLFNHPRQPLSDDERDEEEKEEPYSPGSPGRDRPPAAGAPVKREKQESSESDNSSDKSSKNNKNNKENNPKNNNGAVPADNNSRDNASSGCNNNNGIKRSGSPEETRAPPDADEDDCRDAPHDEARFVCTLSWYLFLRLHGVLCQRLGEARRSALRVADQEAREQRERHPSVALALRLKPNTDLPSEAGSPGGYYTALLELVKGVLDGNVEAGAYEDAAREMLGIRAYPAYTLDKVVSYAVRQLQHCVSEPWSLRAWELAARGARAPSAAGAAYVRRARRALRNEHTFLVRLSGGEECRVSFELLEGAGAPPDGKGSPGRDDGRLSPDGQGRTPSSAETTVSRLAAWSLYTERYVRPDLASCPLPPANKPVFLSRNARRCGGGRAETRVAAAARAPGPQAAHARRKAPPKIVDNSECTLTAALRYTPFATNVDGDATPSPISAGCPTRCTRVARAAARRSTCAPAQVVADARARPLLREGTRRPDRKRPRTPPASPTPRRGPEDTCKTRVILPS
ncbi:Paired amphipathic helix protein Sin3a [Eumeta japonica]|uniref:Paired amphipathic helix protein Sin3b n=1 Tax=Eumeta variegata TaxID=151549 RepID=A0A4C1V7P8_EUMVA|nr:Paired amphipathic helix protein Sin3a [Eumeta japonica]